MAPETDPEAVVSTAWTARQSGPTGTGSVSGLGHRLLETNAIVKAVEFRKTSEMNHGLRGGEDFKLSRVNKAPVANGLGHYKGT